MYCHFLVDIPTDTGKISFNKRAGTTYVEYTYERVYDKKRRYNVPRRTTIGKLSESDRQKMYPNPNFEKFFPNLVPQQLLVSSDRSSCIRVGAFIVIKKVIESYDLQKCLARRDARGVGLLLDLAAYSIVCESNVAQHYPEYAYNHPLMTPAHNIYSDSTVSRFLSEIDANDRLGFLERWNDRRHKRERIYVSYDSTNKNCKAGEIEKAEYGHAKEDCGAPIFNYAVAYDVENQVPLIYECYPGSIVDVSQLQYAIEKLQGYGYRDIAMILDRGYFSKDNIRFMESCGFAFVIMVRGKASFVNELILEKRGLFETKRACVITAYDTYGMTIREKLYADDEKERYFHLYYSMSRQCAERVQLENTLRQMEDLMDRARGSSLELAKPYEHYFNLVYHEAEGVKKFYGYSEREDVIEEELKTCGYFALVTSEKMTATEALPLYKSRDASEKLFCSDKSFLGNRTARAMSDDVLEGKIFVEFVALIIRSRIYTLLRKRVAEMPRKPNFMTVPAALRELEKIELIRQPNGAYKLDHAITATQKTILGAFGLDESAVRIAAAEIGTELQDAKEAGKETDDAPY